MSCIAIDFGSAYSMVARLNEAGIPTLIGDAQEPDRWQTPSLVHLSATGALVGQPAEIAACVEPECPTLRDFKAMLGSGRTLAVDPTKKSWSADECATLLLSKLRQDASAHCLQAVDEVLLTVPSRFTSAQRHALCNAAVAAGLRVRGLIDECVAAAAFAASQNSTERTVLVVQCGRSGFAVAVMRCSQGGVAVRAARHDGSLRGKSIDQRLADQICAAQGWQRETMTRAADAELLRFAERLKIAISEAGTGQVQRHGCVGKLAVEFVLTHWHFRQLVEPMLDLAMTTTEKCLSEARLDWTQIDQVLLTGGTTQLPALRCALLQRSGLGAERLTSTDSGAAVVYGAALLAALPDERLEQYRGSATTSGASADQAVPTPPGCWPVDSLPAAGLPTALFDFGIRIGDPRSGQAAIYKLIKRGTPLPSTASKQFRTSRADQPRLIIEAVRTAGSLRQAESLGHFALALPAGLPANHPVTVTMYSDAAGQVRIEAESASEEQTKR